MDPLLKQLSHAPMPAVADAVRARVDAITVDWIERIVGVRPDLGRLGLDELRDSTPPILTAIADAMASGGPGGASGLVARAPQQGVTRFDQHVDADELFQEDRLLRAAVVRHVEAELGRQMAAAESAALHALLDVMVQRSVVAMVDRQRDALRRAGERERRCLAFLSRDLNDSLARAAASLDVLRLGTGADAAPASTQQATSMRSAALIDAAQQAIAQATRGLRGLLVYERSAGRGGAAGRDGDGPDGGVARAVEPFSARRYLEQLRAEFEHDARDKGLLLRVEVEPDFELALEPSLASLALRNLIGNAIRFSASGTVRLRGHAHPPEDRIGWTLSVADEGPGIAADARARIAEALAGRDAFDRGAAPARDDGTSAAASGDAAATIGLGLAIAARAAAVLGAELDVTSEPGHGSTFLLRLPRPTR